MTDEAQKDDRCTGVENGQRVEFDHPSCGGRAGLVKANGRITLAYLTNKAGGKPPQVGDEIPVLVDGEAERFKVLDVKSSKAPPMYQLRLAEIAA